MKTSPFNHVHEQKISDSWKFKCEISPFCHFAKILSPWKKPAYGITYSIKCYIMRSHMSTHACTGANVNIFTWGGKQLCPTASVNKIMCFVWSCKANIDTVLCSMNKTYLVEPLNFCLVQIWVKSSKVSVYYSMITKHCNFNTKIDSPPSANVTGPEKIIIFHHEQNGT